MTDWLISLEGTPEGLRLAMILALCAAILHAIFGALQKGRHDPWLSRAAIDACYGLLAAPLALFVVPWPEPHLWPILAAAWVIHTGYKLLQAMAYSRGAYTVVYPVVRGTGPLFTVIGAWMLFGETFNAVQWAGVAVLTGGIYGLALYNLRTVTVDRETLVPALALAVATGGFVALYTTWDAYGIRATADPFTFLAWLFLIDSFAIPLLTWRRWTALPRDQIAGLARRGLVGALVAFASFGGIMLATRLGPVGQAAVLRETSTVFAALIGWLMLGERTGPRRVALMATIAAGAVIVQLAA
jgi:drug/metabolite transporter (DMT)-like permease